MTAPCIDSEILPDHNSMAMFDFNFSPSNRQLRQFGAVCMVAVPLVAWLWTGDAVIVGWAAAVGVTLCGIV